jgi:hypothetical protein
MTTETAPSQAQIDQLADAAIAALPPAAPDTLSDGHTRQSGNLTAPAPPEDASLASAAQVLANLRRSDPGKLRVSDDQPPRNPEWEAPEVTLKDKYGEDFSPDHPIKMKDAAARLAEYRQQAAVEPTTGTIPADLDQPVLEAPQESPEQQAAALQARSEAEIATAVDYQRQFAERAGQALASVAAVYQAEFPDVQTAEDAAVLKLSDPVRYGRFVQVNNAVQEHAAEYQRQQHAAAQIRQHQQAEWEARENQKFAARHPDLADANAREQISRDVIDYFKDMVANGLMTPEQAQQVANDPYYKGAAVKETLLNAVHGWKIRQTGKTLRPTQKRVPPPMLSDAGGAAVPSALTDRASRADAALRSAGNRERVGLAAAADLLAARRAARR